MQGDHAVPDFIGCLMGRRGLADVDAGAVNEYVETAQCLHHLVGGAIRLLAVGQIRPDHQRFTAVEGRQPFGGCAGLIGMLRSADGDMGTLGSKGLDNGCADTTRSPGDVRPSAAKEFPHMLYTLSRQVTVGCY